MLQYTNRILLQLQLSHRSCLCCQNDVPSKTECRRLEETGEVDAASGHTGPITLYGHSGTPIEYVSDWNFVADYACVLRISFRAKLGVLERNLEKVTKKRYA